MLNFEKNNKIANFIANSTYILIRLFQKKE